MSKPKRKRVWMALGFMAVVLVVTFLFRPATKASFKVAQVEAPAVSVAPRRPPPSPAPAAKAAPPEDEGSPIVESVTVEKKEVCRGEENLVTVKASVRDGHPENLRIMMPGLGVGGPQMPFRLDATPEPGADLEIVVYGASEIPTRVPLPRVVVKDCEVERAAMVQIQLMPNSTARFELTAGLSMPRPGAMEEKPFVPQRYEWDFGDESTDVTRVPRTEHDYADREQKSRFSSFLISVRIIAEDGRSIMARRSFELANRAFDTLAIKKIVSIQAELNPRIPKLEQNGSVRQNVRLHHAYPLPITIDEVRIVDFIASANGQLQERERIVSPDQVLGFSILDPGAGREVTQVLDSNLDKDVSFRNVEMRGYSDDGLPAQGLFSVMRPPPPPTRETAVRVSDPRLKAEILEARRLLGQEFVNEEDLSRLRAEGRFAQLAVADVPSGQHAQDDPPVEGPLPKPLRPAPARAREQ